MNNSFSSPSTDEPLAGNPRVHEEGRQNYERNNKSSDWFAHKSEAVDFRPESRMRSEAARANALKNHGSVQDDLRGYSEEPITNNSHSEDVKITAQEHFEVVKEAAVNNLVENYTKLELSSQPSSKVTSPEIEAHKEIVQESSSVSVNHVNEAPTPALEQSPPLNLGSSGGENAEKQKREPVKSKGAKPFKGRLHQESAGNGWNQTTPHHRLRADGEGIAKKNNTDSITEIILQNNNVPEVKESKDVNGTETYTPRKPPQPRIRPDGLQNLQKAMNHSEMSAIMHQSPVEPTPPRPTSGRKILPHMQRSELW